MTQVYQSNFDNVTLNATPAGWTAVVGAFVAQNAANGARPVSGTQATLTQGADGNIALLSAAGALASADFQSSHIAYIANNDIAINHHLLRSDATFQNGYRVAIVYSGGTYTGVLLKRISGADTNLGSGTGTPVPLAVSNGDVVLMATTITGNTIDLYLWKQGGSRPSTPNYTWTDNAISAAGEVGFWSASGASGVGASSDDVVVDDMSGSSPSSGGIFQTRRRTSRKVLHHP